MFLSVFTCIKPGSQCCMSNLAHEQTQNPFTTFCIVSFCGHKDNIHVFCRKHLQMRFLLQFWRRGSWYKSKFVIAVSREICPSTKTDTVCNWLVEWRYFPAVSVMYNINIFVLTLQAFSTDREMDDIQVVESKPLLVDRELPVSEWNWMIYK